MSYFIEKYLLENTNLKNDDILNLYYYGSYVYGTNNAFSDADFICIVKFIPIVGNTIIDDKNMINVQFYTEQDFNAALKANEISALECLFLNEDCIIKQTIQFNYKPNLGALRTSISTITSNSWVKGKKKITILGDYDLNAGIKSVFHSLRILDLGIQLATNGKIVDYKRMNYVLFDLKKLSETNSYNLLWEKINTKYLGVYKELKNKFKSFCPKENIDHFKEQENLREIFKKYKIEHPLLTQIIKEILNEIK